MPIHPSTARICGHVEKLVGVLDPGVVPPTLVIGTGAAFDTEVSRVNARYVWEIGVGYICPVIVAGKAVQTHGFLKILGRDS